MKKLMIAAFVLFTFVMKGQSVIKTETILSDTANNPVLIGAYLHSTYRYFIPQENGLYILYRKAIVAPSASVEKKVLGIEEAAIFFHKDSIPDVWNTLKNYYMNTLRPLLEDSLMKVENENWKEIMIVPTE